MNIKTVAAAATTIAAALVLAGCGTNGSGAAAPATPPATSASAAPAAPSSQHNEADVAFVQGMIPHHTQAVQMAQLAPERAGSEQVKQLATRIEQAQGPEIAQMRGFLAAWGVTESGGAMPGMGGGMNHNAMRHSGMSGMMSDQQMQQLTQARGAAFDRMFLQMMTEHHQGAVRMARAELDGGSNPDAKALAQQIIDAQQSEIDEMKRLLAA